MHPSSFTGTDLNRHLEGLGKKMIVLVGENFPFSRPLACFIGELGRLIYLRVCRVYGLCIHLFHRSLLFLRLSVFATAAVADKMRVLGACLRVRYVESRRGAGV